MVNLTSNQEVDTIQAIIDSVASNRDKQVTEKFSLKDELKNNQ